MTRRRSVAAAKAERSSARAAGLRSVAAAAAAAAPTAAAGRVELKLGFDVDEPWTANAENCLSTFAAPQLGQVTTCSAERTSSSK